MAVTTAIICGTGTWTRPSRPAKLCPDFQPIPAATGVELKNATCSLCIRFTERKVKEVKGK